MILVLDDDTSMLGSIKRLLKCRGFVADVFDTVEDFLARADLKNAACLVIDIHLNGISGIELKRRLALAGISLPVIFITGNDSETTRKAALDAGCVAFLSRPFLAKKLLEAIRNALAPPIVR